MQLSCNKKKHCIFATKLHIMNTIKQAKWGMWLSGLCAIHCLLTPIALVAMPMIGSQFTHNHIAEYILIGLGFLFSFSSALKSYLNIHRNISVIFSTILGFVMIISGHLFDNTSLEVTLSILGSVVVIYSLYRNNVLLKQCSCNA